MRRSAWVVLISYLNYRAKYIGRRFTLKVLRGYVHDHSNCTDWTIYSYRAWLTKAGYLERQERGVYKVKKKIPGDCTPRDIRMKAYGKGE